MIAIDASFTGAYFFEDEANARIDQVMQRCADEGATAPSIWIVEVANIFRMALKRGRITFEQRSTYFEQLQAFGVQIDVTGQDVAWKEVTALADRHDLTVYDAAYLEVAVRRDLALATLDRKLIRAAEKEGLEVLPSAV